MGTWRESFAPEIAKIIADNAGKTQQELRKILLADGPSDPPYWQRRMWCDEVRVQLGLKVPKSTLRPKRESDDDDKTPSMFEA